MCFHILCASVPFPQICLRLIGFVLRLVIGAALGIEFRIVGCCFLDNFQFRRTESCFVGGRGAELQGS